MGMYATINDREVKYSGLLAQAGSTIKPVDMGFIDFTFDEAKTLAFRLADLIDSIKLATGAIEYQQVAEVRFGADKLMDILLWISEASDTDTLTFA